MICRSVFLRVFPCLLVGLAQHAHAQQQRGLQWSGSVGVMTDDNLLRAPAGEEVSDRITTQTLGLKVGLPLGLQHLDVDAKVATNQYRTKTDFDNISQNYNAVLRWTLAPRLNGAVTTSRAESLVEAIDSLNPNQSNKNTTTTTSFNAAYDLSGPWQVSATGGATSSRNERAVLGTGDNRFNFASMGLGYSKSKEKSLSYSFQQVTGSNIADYVASVHTLSGSTQISGNSVASIKVSYSAQKFSETPAFDFSGLSGNVNLTWSLSGRTSIGAGWQREITGFQTLGTTHIQTDSVTFSPVWQVSPKSSVRLQFRKALRSDQGNPFGTKTSRQDDLQDVAFTANWAPYSNATLSATVSETTMNSNARFNGKALDFVDRKSGLSAQLSF